ncbi:MAG: hypothetical protein RR400_00860 [Clostridia bacterium]
MIDKRSQTLLNYINKECAEGSYKTLEICDIIGCFDKKLKVDKDLVFQVLTNLEINEFVDVKYHDNNVVCLAPLPKGRFEFERFNENKQIKASSKQAKNNQIVLIFFSAFLGAFLGCLVAIITLR